MFSSVYKCFGSINKPDIFFLFFDRIDTTDFAAKVRKYNKKDPFNFPSNFIMKNLSIYISIYAAHLYDSVMLYAKALHQMISEREKNGEFVGEEQIHDLARDGRGITQTIINMGGFKSISGNYIQINANGHSEGNFTAFALKPHNYTRVSRYSVSSKITCSHYPMKVNFIVANLLFGYPVITFLCLGWRVL